MKKYIGYTLVLILSATIAYWVMMYYTPFIIVANTRTKIGLDYNQVKYAPGLASSKRRTVVMPAPDFLNAIAYYNLSEGPLILESDVPKDNYWSLSLFYPNTINFYVINDRQVKDGKLKLIICHKNQKIDTPTDGSQIFYTDYETGVLLTRILVKTPEDLEKIEKIQKSFTLRKFK